MPRYLARLSYLALGASIFTLLFVALGPSEGLEALGGVLVAWFALWFHVAIGPLYLLHVLRAHRITPALGFMLLYLCLVYAAGAWVWIVSSDIDDAVVSNIDRHRDPDGFRLRELAELAYRNHQMGRTLPASSAGELAALVAASRAPYPRGRKRSSVLWYIAASGNTGLLGQLLERGAPAADDTLYDSPPLVVAASNGHTQTVRMLLAAGADPNAAAHPQNLPLARALKAGEFGLIESLLEAGADPNRGEPQPLAYAVREQRADLVELLLSHGAEQQAWYGRTPVEIALENANGTILALLRAAGGFDRVIDGRNPPLFGFMQRCDTVPFVRELAAGASANAVNSRGYSLLHEAILLNTRTCDFDEVRGQFVQALIDAGADINEKNQQGTSMVLTALRRGHAAAARLLVAAGAALDGQYNKADFLALAAGAGARDLVDTALARGFDINHWEPGLNGKSALYAAVTAAQSKTVVHLFQRGATLPSDHVKLANLFYFAAADQATLAALLEHYLRGPRDADVDRVVRRNVERQKNAAATALVDSAGL